MNRRVNRLVALGMLGLLMGLGLGGCALMSDKPKPAPLEPITGGVSAPLLWSASGGRVDFPLQPGLVGDRLATAASDGTVVVRQLSSATPLWTARVNARLSAGVGFDGRHAAVVTQTNELVLLVEGREVWRKRLASRVTTAPLVAGERVFLLGLDRAVEAYDVLDGRYLWRLQRSGDPLSVEMSGVLIAHRDTLIVGQGARLIGVDPNRGSVRWDIPLATPRGTNEVERLSDLVGPPVRLGDTVCARAFQSAVACADVSRSALRWTRNVGGIQAIGGSAELIVGADASDRLTAWKTETGELLWSHERLLHRGLAGWTAWGKWVVAGDEQGLMHVLDAATGQTVARLSTDGSALIGAPRVQGRHLIAATRRGGLFVWTAP